MENCDQCMKDWIKKDKYLSGYKYMINDQHIPKAHDYQDFDQASASAPAPTTSPPSGEEIDETEVTLEKSWHLPLYKAAMLGDWDSAKPIILEHGPEALGDRIRRDSETVLHVAVRSGSGKKLFVDELLKLLAPADLERQTSDGWTPLGIAAKIGNLEAAKLLVAKHSKLVYLLDGNNSLPIHITAKYAQKEMLLLMLQLTDKKHYLDSDHPNSWGSELLLYVIKAEFYEIALHLLQSMPELASSRITDYLSILAQNPSIFSCLRSEGYFQPLIDACVPKLPKMSSYWRKTHDIENNVGDDRNVLKNPQRYFQLLLLGMHKIHYVLWRIFEEIVPPLKSVKNEILKGVQARRLVKCLCREAVNQLEKSSNTIRIFEAPLIIATENGTVEIVKEIMKHFPEWYHMDIIVLVFKLAIENRHHEIYNLVCEMKDLHIDIISHTSLEGENILNWVANMAPLSRLRHISGAALQMQREIQWFEEIESTLQPWFKTKLNESSKTAEQIFTESHQKLIEAGEQWMRQTATSCTGVAALISTVTFAAAITVPGGNNENTGNPIFSSEKAFISFGIANGVSLFTASVSILMFLSILMSRYAERDFLRSLPTRLIIGILSLFLSVTSMVMAFSSILYMVFGHRSSWILGCVIAPSCLVVLTFAIMQCSLFGQLISSTYRCKLFKRGIKKKVHFKSNRWSSLFKKGN